MMIKLLVFVTLAIVQVQLSEIDRNIRIVGGSIARFNQFPHVVGLILHTGVDQHSFCGGNIIHPAYILTVSFYGEVDLISIELDLFGDFVCLKFKSG